jgi:predicted ATPase/DNA-binding SARP family transcriptional activator
MPPVTDQRLPVRLAPLVGRERELRAILQALAQGRLLTLTGPGGTGKTRLALATADAAAASYQDGVCWIELAPLNDPEIVGQEVATRLSVPDSGQDPAAAIAEHVADGQVLLVLDNCEHLAAAVAQLAESLLAACPALTILATSREVLGVEGEQNWPVPPLALPDAGEQVAPDHLADFDALRLFEQRAQLVRPSFRLAADNAAAVLAVCERLDGLPLAIELAAARMRILSIGQLAERLDDMFGVLVGGTRSAPARHQTLRATLDWSYDLLDEEERAVFRRLSAFAGGFGLTAAEQVVAGDDLAAERVLDVLERLADKSLVHVNHAAAEARYHLLGTVLDYAREHLASSPAEEDAARRAHLRYFIGFVQEVAPRIDRGADGVHALERQLDSLDVETPNLRAALYFARQVSDKVGALQLAGPLGHYAYLRGHYHEVRQWMDAVVTGTGSAPASLRAQALLGSGWLALLQCDYVPAVRRLEAALRVYRELDDQLGVAAALHVLGGVAREQGRYARALELHADSLATAAAAGDRWAIARAHNHLGFVRWLQGDFDAAAGYCTVALTLARELPDVEEIAWALISLGTIARYQGDPSRAATLLAESRALAERVGFREGIAWSLEQLGLLALDRGEADAAQLLHASLVIHHQLRDRWRICSLLDDMAAVAVARGQPALAASLLGTAEALREEIGTVVAPCERALHDQTVASTRSALRAPDFDVAWQQGRLADDEAVRDRLARLGDDGQAGAQRTADAGTAAAVAPPILADALGGGAPAEPAAAPQVKPARVRRPAAITAGGVLRITTLGAATVHRGETPVTAADFGYAKPRELLFLLVASPALTRDQLGAALWPDLPPHRLGNALHTGLRGVRRALGDADWIRYSDGRYSFNAAREHDCDVIVFEGALADARRARPAKAALPHLQHALAAYGGDFLAGMNTGIWAEARRAELSRSYESALLAAGRLLVAAGRLLPAAGVFRRAIAHEPLDETAHRELMSCWAQLGETARAVRHYEDLAELLRAQVGVPPAAETTALYRKLSGGGVEA